MKRKRPAYRISIPKPCHENWDQMTPVERGRHCASCQNVVKDFTSMSNKEIYAAFANNKGGLCGRFYNFQLNAVYQPVNEHTGRNAWLPAALLAGAALVPVVTDGQTVIGDTLSVENVTAETVPIKTESIQSLTTNGSEMEIKGKVTDSSGEPIPFAQITIVQSGIGTISDIDGHYSLIVPSSILADSKIEIKALGFEPVLTNILDDDIKALDANKATNFMLQPTMMVPCHVVTMGLVYSVQEIPLVDEILVDTTTAEEEVIIVEEDYATESLYFTISPNPVQSIAEIHLSWFPKEPYELLVTDMQGKTVLVKSGLTSNSLPLDVTDLPAGQYTCALLRQGQKPVTRSFLVAR